MSSNETAQNASRGGLSAAAGFIAWGIVPIYWKQLHDIAAIELITHRLVWSLVFLVGVLAWQKNLGTLRAGFTSPRVIGLNLISSVLLTVNWLTYVWGVNQGFIIECSLGYFLTPLCNVALGYLILHERPRPLQWAAIGCAAVGVGVLLLKLGHFPWIAIVIAGTWATYGLLKKKSALGPLAGLTAETLLLLPLAVGALLWWHHTGQGALGRVNAWQHTLILSAGWITAIPLLLFAYGAQRVRLTTLGLLQYLAPTVQFLIGLFVYHEAFDTGRLQAFAIIWIGLLLYTADGFWTQRRTFLKTVAGS
ncbi:EamA family transporter RarD [Oleiharenicola lentus]|uniref:EamA family transporter RarD n=1 Tax=Oleiharenicola lentus TaxID=2508720 RepID=UPI003F678BC5